LKAESRVIKRIDFRSRGYLGIVERIGRICGSYWCVGYVLGYGGVDAVNWGAWASK